MLNSVLLIIRLAEKEIRAAEERGDMETFDRLCNGVNAILPDVSGKAKKSKRNKITPDMSGLQRFEARYGN